MPRFWIRIWIEEIDGFKTDFSSRKLAKQIHQIRAQPNQSLWRRIVDFTKAKLGAIHADHPMPGVFCLQPQAALTGPAARIQDERRPRTRQSAKERLKSGLAVRRNRPQIGLTVVFFEQSLQIRMRPRLRTLRPLGSCGIREVRTTS